MLLTERKQLEAEELEDRLIRIDRTRKTVKGGRISSARVVMAVGDNKGRVGLGVGKARNVPEAIGKGIKLAKKQMISIPLDGYTIPHTVQAKVGGAIILLKPASRGTGIVAGGATRQLIEVSGIRDVLTKSLGSGNVMNRAKACLKALSMLRDPRQVAKERETTVKAMLGREVVNPYAETKEEKKIVEEVVKAVAKEADQRVAPQEGEVGGGAQAQEVADGEEELSEKDEETTGE